MFISFFAFKKVFKWFAVTAKYSGAKFFLRPLAIHGAASIAPSVVLIPCGAARR
jgi:hypothetical protein